MTTTFREGAERTKALGVWAAIAVGGGAVGLVLGGFLVEMLSWPWIFFVNVPVGIVAFILSLRLVPESKDEHAHKSFDLAGAATVTGGLIALVYGIVRSAEAGWGSAEVLGFLALAAVLLVAFVLIERRSAEPLVRLSIFSVKTVRGANVAMFVVAAGLFAMFFFNTLYVQRVLGFSPLEAGFAFVPFTAGVIVGAGRLAAARSGARRARGAPDRPRASARPGCSRFLRLTPDSSYLTDLLPGILLASVGMGLVFVPITLIATSGIPADDAGLASGLFNTSQQIGGALGLALLSTFATSRTTDELSSLGHAPTQADQAEALVSGFHVAWALSRDLPRSWPRCSSPCSCAAATWSRWPRARPRPPSRSAGEDSRRRRRGRALAAGARTPTRPRHARSSRAGAAAPPVSHSAVGPLHPAGEGEGKASEHADDPEHDVPGDEEDHAEDDRGHEHTQCDEKSHVLSPSARVNGAYCPSGTMATWS